MEKVIVIKGAKMPTSCIGCEFVKNTVIGCKLSPKEKMSVIDYYRIPSWCRLAEREINDNLII